MRDQKTFKFKLGKLISLLITFPSKESFPNKNSDKKTVSFYKAGNLYLTIFENFKIRIFQKRALVNGCLDITVSPKYKVIVSIGIFSNMEIFRALNFWDVIYMDYFSRDCDMCETSSVSKFPNYYSYRVAEASQAEWADGPFSYTPISKNEYKDRKGFSSSRDRILEAYENGNGNSIYV